MRRYFQKNDTYGPSVNSHGSQSRAKQPAFNNLFNNGSRGEMSDGGGETIPLVSYPSTSAIPRSRYTNNPYYTRTDSSQSLSDDYNVNDILDELSDDDLNINLQPQTMSGSEEQANLIMSGKSTPSKITPRSLFSTNTRMNTSFSASSHSKDSRRSRDFVNDNTTDDGDDTSARNSTHSEEDEALIHARNASSTGKLRRSLGSEVSQLSFQLSKARKHIKSLNSQLAEAFSSKMELLEQNEGLSKQVKALRQDLETRQDNQTLNSLNIPTPDSIHQAGQAVRSSNMSKKERLRYQRCITELRNKVASLEREQIDLRKELMREQEDNAALSVKEKKEDDLLPSSSSSTEVLNISTSNGTISSGTEVQLEKDLQERNNQVEKLAHDLGRAEGLIKELRTESSIKDQLINRLEKDIEQLNNTCEKLKEESSTSSPSSLLSATDGNSSTRIERQVTGKKNIKPDPLIDHLKVELAHAHTSVENLRSVLDEQTRELGEMRQRQDRERIEKENELQKHAKDRQDITELFAQHQYKLFKDLEAFKNEFKKEMNHELKIAESALDSAVSELKETKQELKELQLQQPPASSLSSTPPEQQRTAPNRSDADNEASNRVNHEEKQDQKRTEAYNNKGENTNDVHKLSVSVAVDDTEKKKKDMEQKKEEKENESSSIEKPQTAQMLDQHEHKSIQPSSSTSSPYSSSSSSTTTTAASSSTTSQIPAKIEAKWYDDYDEETEEDDTDGSYLYPFERKDYSNHPEVNLKINGSIQPDLLAFPLSLGSRHAMPKSSNMNSILKDLRDSATLSTWQTPTNYSRRDLVDKSNQSQSKNNDNKNDDESAGKQVDQVGGGPYIAVGMHAYIQSNPILLREAYARFESHPTMAYTETVQEYLGRCGLISKVYGAKNFRTLTIEFEKAEAEKVSMSFMSPEHKQNLVNCVEFPFEAVHSTQILNPDDIDRHKGGEALIIPDKHWLEQSFSRVVDDELSGPSQQKLNHAGQIGQLIQIYQDNTVSIRFLVDNLTLDFPFESISELVYENVAVTWDMDNDGVPDHTPALVEQPTYKIDSTHRASLADDPESGYHCKVTVACLDLTHEQLFEPDPKCMVTSFNPQTGFWERVGETETQANNPSPNFSDAIDIFHMPKSHRIYRFEIKDMDGDYESCSLGFNRIMCSEIHQNDKLILPLYDVSNQHCNEGQSTLVLRAVPGFTPTLMKQAEFLQLMQIKRLKETGQYHPGDEEKEVKEEDEDAHFHAIRRIERKITEREKKSRKRYGGYGSPLPTIRQDGEGIDVVKVEDEEKQNVGQLAYEPLYHRHGPPRAVMQSIDDSIKLKSSKVQVLHNTVKHRLVYGQRLTHRDHSKGPAPLIANVGVRHSGFFQFEVEIVRPGFVLFGWSAEIPHSFKHNAVERADGRTKIVHPSPVNSRFRAVISADSHTERADSQIRVVQGFQYEAIWNPGCRDEAGESVWNFLYKYENKDPRYQTLLEVKEDDVFSFCLDLDSRPRQICVKRNGCLEPDRTFTIPDEEFDPLAWYYPVGILWPGSKVTMKLDPDTVYYLDTVQKRPGLTMSEKEIHTMLDSPVFETKLELETRNIYIFSVLKEIFNFLDKDRTGTLDPQETLSALHFLAIRESKSGESIAKEQEKRARNHHFVKQLSLWSFFSGYFVPLQNLSAETRVVTLRDWLPPQSEFELENKSTANEYLKLNDFYQLYFKIFVQSWTKERLKELEEEAKQAKDEEGGESSSSTADTLTKRVYKQAERNGDGSLKPLEVEETNPLARMNLFRRRIDFAAFRSDLEEDFLCADCCCDCCARNCSCCGKIEQTLEDSLASVWSVAEVLLGVFLLPCFMFFQAIRSSWQVFGSKSQFVSIHIKSVCGKLMVTYRSAFICSICSNLLVFVIFAPIYYAAVIPLILFITEYGLAFTGGSTSILEAGTPMFIFISVNLIMVNYSTTRRARQKKKYMYRDFFRGLLLEDEEERLRRSKLATSLMATHEFDDTRILYISIEQMRRQLVLLAEKMHSGNCWTGFLQWGLPGLIACIHCLIPGSVRTTDDSSFFATDEETVDHLIALLHVSFSAPLLYALFWWLYREIDQFQTDVTSALNNLTAITSSQGARSIGSPYWLDISEGDNINGWIMLRNSMLKLIHRISRRTLSLLVPIIILALFLALITFLRIFLYNKRTLDVFNAQAVFDLFVLLIYIAAVLLAMAKANEAIGSHAGVFSSRMFDLAHEMCLENVVLEMNQNKLKYDLDSSDDDNDDDDDGFQLFDLQSPTPLTQDNMDNKESKKKRKKKNKRQKKRREKEERLDSPEGQKDFPWSPSIISSTSCNQAVTNAIDSFHQRKVHRQPASYQQQLESSPTAMVSLQAGPVSSLSSASSHAGVDQQTVRLSSSHPKANKLNKAIAAGIKDLKKKLKAFSSVKDTYQINSNSNLKYHKLVHLEKAMHAIKGSGRLTIWGFSISATEVKKLAATGIAALGSYVYTLISEQLDL